MQKEDCELDDEPGRLREAELRLMMRYLEVEMARGISEELLRQRAMLSEQLQAISSHKLSHKIKSINQALEDSFPNRVLYLPTYRRIEQDLSAIVPELAASSAFRRSIRKAHEPSDLEETLFPAGPDIYLVLITSGTVQVDEREIHGSWVTYTLHEGNWFLTPAGGEPYALRWKSLSTDPLKTLHLHLSTDLFARTIQQVVDRDPSRVMVLAGWLQPIPLRPPLSPDNRRESPSICPASAS